MKKFIIPFLTLFFAVSTLFAQQGNCVALSMAKQDLNKAEKNTLIAMAQEEKMAEDFYKAMSEQWNLPMFANIHKSEIRHKTILVGLIDKYGLENPVNDAKAGSYKNKEIQKLYNQLVSDGKKSLQDALISAALLEEQDYVDLQKAIDNTDNDDLKMAYTNLQRGTTHHLKAAVNLLKNRFGYNYKPQILPQETFDMIISTPKNGRKGANK